MACFELFFHGDLDDKVPAGVCDDGTSSAGSFDWIICLLISELFSIVLFYSLLVIQCFNFLLAQEQEVDVNCDVVKLN